MRQEHEAGTHNWNTNEQHRISDTDINQRSDNERRSGVSIYMIANELQLCDGDGMMEISFPLARTHTCVNNSDTRQGGNSEFTNRDSTPPPRDASWRPQTPLPVDCNHQ